MCFRLVIVLAAYLSTTTSESGGTNSSSASLRASSPIEARATEPPTAVVAVGTTAPDFSYQSSDGRWQHLHDVLRDGPVVLVFGARESELRALDKERDALLDLGVVPVAVVDGRASRVWSMVRRTGLRSLVLADPRHVIASQFNLVQPPTLSPVQAWFVIDRQGRVRRLERGRLPAAPYVEVAAQALGLPLPGVTLPAAR